MQAAAEAGNLGAALAEREALPEPALAASADWAASASARLALDAAVAALVGAMGTAPNP